MVPYGSSEGAFFGELLESRMCAEARELGHEARIVRVHYDGRDAERDKEVGRRLLDHLEACGVDLLVTERLFDPAPIRAFRAAGPERRVMLLAQGEVPRELQGIDLVMGDHAGRPEGKRADLLPADLLLDAWEAVLSGLSAGRPIEGIPGISVVRAGVLEPAPAFGRASRRRPFRATVEADAIALGEAPTPTHRTLFGTYGCPYAGDPTETAHHAGLRLPTDRPVAKLGCAFCHMGGDYVAGTDASIVHDLIEQASHWLRHDPAIDRLLLADQHPLRYLELLMDEAAKARLRPVRWLFAARADAFVREQSALGRAVIAAERTGQRLEVYLTGFESFSDAELARYNKGLSVQDQLRAVEVMRALHARHPGAFAYADARGHSLILWNPWTLPSDLEASTLAIREHGLRELFHELGRNRLRLHPNLPIFHAAERDEALTEDWDEAGVGAGRAKGYGQEHPWRFLDARTRLAYPLARALRSELGLETELAQLIAVTRFVEPRGHGSIEQTVEQVLDALGALRDTLGDLASGRGTRGLRRAPSIRATRVDFAGACNNGCASCANRDRFLPDDAESLAQRVRTARERGTAVVLAGREPTLHPTFLDLCRLARGEDARVVGVVSNGRRFAYERFAMAARRAGLTSASVKLFGAEPGAADARTRVPGAHAQALEGLANLLRAGVATEVRAPLHRGMLDDAERLVDLVAASGARGLRIEVELDAIGLDGLTDCREAVERIAERCAHRDLALDASPLGSGLVPVIPSPQP